MAKAQSGEMPKLCSYGSGAKTTLHSCMVQYCSKLQQKRTKMQCNLMIKVNAVGTPLDFLLLCMGMGPVEKKKLNPLD